MLEGVATDSGPRDHPVRARLRQVFKLSFFCAKTPAEPTTQALYNCTDVFGHKVLGIGVVLFEVFLLYYLIK